MMDITKLITPHDSVEQTPAATRSSPAPSSLYPPTSTAKPPPDALMKAQSSPPRSSPVPPHEHANDALSSPSLSQEEKDEARQLQEVIQKDRQSCYHRARLIELLHCAFSRHARSSSPSEIANDINIREQLARLRTAREDLVGVFAIHEQFWLDWIEDESFAAQAVPDCVKVIDICRRAVEQECGSTRLWTTYTDYIYRLYHAAQSGKSIHGDDAWSQQDIDAARGVFTWQCVLETFTNAAQTNLYRLDNTEIWDKYLEIILKNLDTSPTPENIEQTRSSFVTRLHAPHRKWDDTFQMFSQFISSYYPSSYEAIMVDVRGKTAAARAQWDARELREDALAGALKDQATDERAECRLYAEYIEWECSQDRRHRRTTFELISAIYERALLRWPTHAVFWNDYVLHLIEEKMAEDARVETRRSQASRRPRHAPQSTMPALDRATRHCPFSGTLWSQYILCAEREGYSFEEISAIKHKATSTGVLESAGVSQVADVYTTFCSYLHRLATQPGSTDDDHLIGEVGIRSALEHLKKAAGDTLFAATPSFPSIQEIVFRLEKMYIQYLSDSGSYDNARERFKSLALNYGQIYEFWYTYYIWELQCWDKFAPSDGTQTKRRKDPPGYATGVLKQAMERVGTGLDEPHKAMAAYLAHCEDYETADGLQEGIILLRKTTKVLNKRLEKEYAQAQQMKFSAAQYEEHVRIAEEQHQQRQQGKEQNQRSQQHQQQRKPVERTHSSKGIRKEKPPTTRPSSVAARPLQQPIRRPAQPGRSIGAKRGGLGVKHGRLPQISRPDKEAGGGSGSAPNANGAEGEEQNQRAASLPVPPKSNNDFRALVSEARSSQKGQGQQESEPTAGNESKNADADADASAGADADTDASPKVDANANAITNGEGDGDEKMNE